MGGFVLCASDAMTRPEDEDGPDEVEERLINEEYKIWKKNTPFLYDLVMTHALEWPSLTVQWLPERFTPPGRDYTRQKMILGTHTSGGEQNYLMIAEVKLPNEDTVVDASAYGATGEYGGHGAEGGVGKVQVTQSLLMDGEVNRARHMPQNPFVIAAKSTTADVLLFDYSKHDSVPPKDGAMAANLRLTGHKMEGYGLSWSPLKTGHLLSGSEDAQICLWDVGSAVPEGSKSGTLRCRETYTGHTGTVEDVVWHPVHASLFGSCGDDSTICLWDMRNGDRAKPVQINNEAHEGEINAMAFHPTQEYLFASGGTDKVVSLWDTRKMETRLASFEAHTAEVYQVNWVPGQPTMLSSCSQDRRLMVWDLSRIGEEQDPEDAKDGPPELLFIHGGHTAKVIDFDWNPGEDWLCASVAEDNVLQVWKMAENIYAEAGKNVHPGDA